MLFPHSRAFFLESISINLLLPFYHFWNEPHKVTIQLKRNFSRCWPFLWLTRWPGTRQRRSFQARLTLIFPQSDRLNTHKKNKFNSNRTSLLSSNQCGVRAGNRAIKPIKITRPAHQNVIHFCIYFPLRFFFSFVILA